MERMKGSAEARVQHLVGHVVTAKSEAELLTKKVTNMEERFQEKRARATLLLKGRGAG